MSKKQRNLNNDIRANKVQLITDDGENLGEMSLAEAKEIWREQSLDLMEMWKTPDLTIVKILDYGKFLYREKKQKQKQKQQTKSPDMKTLRITFKIWDHDLEIRRRQAEKFAAGGHALKVSLMLRGRENHYRELALAKINSFVDSLEDIYKKEGFVKWTWNVFTCILKPKQ